MSDANADNKKNKKDDDRSDEEEEGEKIRVSLTLAPEVSDRTLEIPSDPIAVPSSISRRGLAAIINHLLDRRVVPDKEEKEEEDSDKDDDEDEDDEDKDKLPALPIDFVLKENNKLLRGSGVEREARRHGLSLEKPLLISYFPAQEAPELEGESETLPDWISCLSYLATDDDKANDEENAYLCAASYDGSLRVYQPKQEHHEKDPVSLTPIAIMAFAHRGPVKCMTAMMDNTSANNNKLLVVSGSMDQTLMVHSFDPKFKELKKEIKCQQGHSSSLGSVDIFPSTKTLASGDWDGTLCLWDLTTAVDPPQEEQQQATKKAKTHKDTAAATIHEPSCQVLTPKVVLPKAHSSQISGISWGNLQKRNNTTTNNLITGSWDHSLKLWDVERQECLLTLNGARVVTCLDTSYHSEGIVATGHPDCTVRLWDVRANNTNDSSSNIVADTTFRPSHKAWVTGVQWSPNNPYHVTSTSHDGTVKVWDIRSSIPLHTVRVFPKKNDKGLCLVYGQYLVQQEKGTTVSSRASLFLGGTDCVVKHFTTKG